MRDNRIKLAGLLALAAALNVGSGAISEANAQQANTITIDGIGGIRIGMTLRQIAPLLEPASDWNRAHGRYSTRSGLTVVTGGHGIAELVFTETARTATLSGARLGMSDRALRGLYLTSLVRTGAPDDTAPSDWTYYYYSSSYNGIRFDLVNGQIRQIRAVFDQSGSYPHEVK